MAAAVGLTYVQLQWIRLNLAADLLEHMGEQILDESVQAPALAGRSAGEERANGLPCRPAAEVKRPGPEHTMRNRYYTPQLDRELVTLLYHTARSRRMPMTRLASALVREGLARLEESTAGREHDRPRGPARCRSRRATISRIINHGANEPGHSGRAFSCPHHNQETKGTIWQLN